MQTGELMESVQKTQPKKYNRNDLIIIVFDGDCNLCNRAVNFIIKRDPAERFAFVPLESSYGQFLVEKFDLQDQSQSTLLFIDNDKCAIRSDAVLFVAAHLSGGWPLLRFFRIIPRSIRDWFYDGIARNRYKLFGRSDKCLVTDKSVSSRFITQKPEL